MAEIPPSRRTGLIAIAATITIVGALSLRTLWSRSHDAHHSLKAWETTFNNTIDGAEVSYENSSSTPRSLCLQMGINFGSPGDLHAGGYPLDLWPTPDRHLTTLLGQWLLVHQQSYADCTNPLPIKDSTYNDIEAYLRSLRASSNAAPLRTPETTTQASIAPGSTTTTQAVAPGHKPSLDGGGLGVVRFGAKADAVISTLTSFLGSPTETRPDTICFLGYQNYDWGSLQIQFDKSNSFINYRYSLNETGKDASPVLTTPERVALGASPQQIRTAYPDADFTNPAYITAMVGGQPLIFVTAAGNAPGVPGPVVEMKAGQLCGDY